MCSRFSPILNLITLDLHKFISGGGDKVGNASAFCGITRFALMAVCPCLVLCGFPDR